MLWSKDMREDLLKIYDIIYDEDFEIYIQNLVYYFKDVYLSTYSKEKINISHLHHYYPIEGFNLNDIFPGSTNILLTTENIIYHKRFLLFFCIKNFKNFNNFNNKNINTIKKLYEKLTNNDYNINDTFDNMHSIDIGKLIFEPDSAIQIENKLSNILQRKIILDRQKLEHYRQTSLKQLKFWEEKGIMIYE